MYSGGVAACMCLCVYIYMRACVCMHEHMRVFECEHLFLLCDLSSQRFTSRRTGTPCRLDTTHTHAHVNGEKCDQCCPREREGVNYYFYV